MPSPKMLRIAKVLADYPQHVHILVPHALVSVLWREGEPPFDQDCPFVPIARVIEL
jgi:hypothetical protein